MTSPWPLIASVPGVSRAHLRAWLHQLWSEAYNIRGGTYGSGFEQLARYLNWAASAVRTLANQITAADIDRLILTRGHDRLLTLAAPSPAAGTHTLSVVNELLNVKLSQRAADLEAARVSPDDALRRRSDLALFVMPDTPVDIEHEKKPADLDFAELMAEQRFPESRLIVLVPIVIIDELDRLKDRSSNAHVKWRAGHSLGFIYDKLKDSDHPVQIQPPDRENRLAEALTGKGVSCWQPNLGPSRKNTRPPAWNSGDRQPGENQATHPDFPMTVDTSPADAALGQPLSRGVISIQQPRPRS
jgi:hypothetical protein